MNIQKELQNRIGELIGKDYFKLEFGVEVIIEGKHYKVLDDFIHLAEISPIYKTVENVLNIELDDLMENVEIIGQEPTLQDLLLAIENKNKDSDVFFSLRTDGDLIRHREIKDDYIITIDLSQSIFSQTPECKSAILSILNNK